MSLHLDPIARAFGPQSTQQREQRVGGVVTGVVTELEENGLYRLRLFGMNGQDDDGPSALARMMTPMAGNGRGMHFFPEAGDEVVVAFQDGDTNQPIILGALWNGGSVVPAQAHESTDNDVRTMVSRSGHELTFDDTPGRERVTVRSHGGRSVVLDDTPGAGGITVTGLLGGTVTIDDTPPGAISIRTTTCQVTLADPGTVRLQASASIALDAPLITIAGAAVTIGAGAGATLVDGVPFALHVHAGGTLPSGTTGPVAA